jgi:hypothetical protein
VLNFLNEASGKEPKHLFTHGLALLLVEASHAFLDRPRTGFDVEGVLSYISRDG